MMSVIAKIFIATLELVITLGITTKEAKAEIGTHLVAVEAKISNSQYDLNSYKSFCVSC